MFQIFPGGHFASPGVIILNADRIHSFERNTGEDSIDIVNLANVGDGLCRFSHRSLQRGSSFKTPVVVGVVAAGVESALAFAEEFSVFEGSVEPSVSHPTRKNPNMPQNKATVTRTVLNKDLITFPRCS